MKSDVSSSRNHYGPVVDRLLSIYERLFAEFGAQHWWPGETPFEVSVGAILTQNTSWDNVSKAISNMKAKGILDPIVLYTLPYEMIADAIRPAGYFNIKTKRLKAFVSFLVERFNADLDDMFSIGLDKLRPLLLDIKGIGPETADSILLYAGGLPTFVVDAYTCRALLRHGLVDEDAVYDDIRALFMDHLPADVSFFNEYHALWVALGKQYCKKNAPRCEACPLKDI
ncbi:MAG: endonuclease III domain-containing protein [Dissulfurimicrobium sp.]|uniref:endonuclease III domain-containing protein n=1 Tax=Dissulfurimicrobium TaxID=1769732 RepID=UPI001EDB74CB|nr:endonuclease III domain-containing protein [Dissulfurimicrobium hydrothermale]UKL13233.1 endonuclease III domain-containing protein [Dissulfurimicrobium hydrothermale]